MCKHTQIVVLQDLFGKSNIFTLVSNSLKVLIIIPSGNLQIEKGETLSFVKMMSQYEFLNTKIIALFFINCFQLIIINGKSVRAALLTKMIILYRIFLKKMTWIKTTLACKYETSQRSSKIKVTQFDFLLAIKEIRCGQKPSLRLE